MIIGFSERRSTVSEGNAASGEEHISVPIGMATLRTAEREHPMNIRLQVSSSTAFVEPIGQVDNLLYDAIFGTRDRSNDPIEVFFVLEALEDTIRSEGTFIRDDFRAEDEECFTIRILPVDVLGRRELFTCNEDDSGAINYFCQTEICIEDDDGRFHVACASYNIILGPFVVAFVETAYTVDESMPAVNVCVDLTQPSKDIIDETVNVYVIDSSHSLYIPSGAPLASKTLPKFIDNNVIRFSYMPQPQMDLTFSVFTPWQMGLTMLSRRLL